MGFTPGPDGDEELDEGEGDGAEDVADEEDDGPGTETPAATGSVTPAVETPRAETPDGEAIPPPLSAFSNATALPSALSAPPLTAASTTPSAAESPAPLPTNAIEMSNTAPIHTEEGLGDLGHGEAGVEIRAPEKKGGEDVEMGPADGEEPPKETPLESESKEGDPLDGAPAPVVAPVVAPAEDAPPTADEGLVMGEMQPPEPGLVVEGGDHPPPEIEKPFNEGETPL